MSSTVDVSGAVSVSVQFGAGPTGLAGPAGPAGPPVSQSLGAFFWEGSLGALELLWRGKLDGPVALDAAHSPLLATRGAAATAVLSVVRNPTFASPLAPTPTEIAAYLWATGTFAASDGSPQPGVTAYVAVRPARLRRATS